MKRSTGAKFIIVLTIFVAGTAAFFMLVFRSQQSQSRPVYSMTLAIQNNIFSALPIIAKEKGFFLENDLDVKLTKHPSGKLALRAMLEGRADLATSAEIPLVVKAFEGEDFRIVATIGFTDTSLKILANKEANITEPKDLAGKTVGAQENSASHYFLEIFLNYHHVPKRAVTTRFFEPDELVKAMKDGLIDAISMRNPYLSQAQEEMTGKTVIFPAPDFYRQYFALVGKTSFVENKKMAKRLLRAMLAARASLYEEPQEAKTILIRFFGQERSEEILAGWNDYRFGVNLGEGFLMTLENQAAWHLSNHPELAKSKPNFLNFIFAEQLEELSPYSVTIRK